MLSHSTDQLAELNHVSVSLPPQVASLQLEAQKRQRTLKNIGKEIARANFTSDGSDEREQKAKDLVFVDENPRIKVSKNERKRNFNSCYVVIQQMFKDHQRSSSSFGFTSASHSKPPLAAPHKKPLRRTSSSGSNQISSKSSSPSPQHTDFQQSPVLYHHSSSSPSPPPSPHRRGPQKPSSKPTNKHPRKIQMKETGKDPESETPPHTHSLCKGLMQYIRREYTDMAEFLEVCVL